MYAHAHAPSGHVCQFRGRAYAHDGLTFAHVQVGGDKPVAGSNWGGYCRHGSQLFPTWHRPYVMLIEQVRVHCGLRG